MMNIYIFFEYTDDFGSAASPNELTVVSILLGLALGFILKKECIRFMRFRVVIVDFIRCMRVRSFFCHSKLKEFDGNFSQSN